MKKHIFLLGLLLTSFCAMAQDAQVYTSIEVQEDTLYFVKTIKVVENATAYPDSLISRDFVGNSNQLAEYLKRLAIEGQQATAYQVAKAFDRQPSKSQFNDLRGLYSGLTGVELYTVLSNDFANFYVTDTLQPKWVNQYRVYNDDGTDFYAKIVVLNSGRYRLRQLTEKEGMETGAEWVVNPYTRRSFQIVNYQGTSYEFFRDLNAENMVFRPAEKVSSNTPFRIVKIR